MTARGPHLSNVGASRQTGGRLVGRTAQVAQIDDFLQRVATYGAALHISGESGVGKTELLHAADERARRAGMLVLSASGTEFEADIPYSGLNQLLLDVYGQAHALAPDLAKALSVALGYGDGEPPERRVVADAALALLRHVSDSAGRPVLLLVDDAQWLDRASASALGFAAHHLAGSRIGLISAARSGHASFYNTDGLTPLPVGPLNDQESAALVDYAVPGLEPAVRRRLLDEARGNPLALLELPAVLRSSPALQPNPELLSLSDRLQAMFAGRIAELGDATKALLLAAVYENSGELRTLNEIAADHTLDFLAAAETSHLVEIDRDAGRMAFRHPLIRSALVGQSTPDERRRAHHALARATGTRWDRRAWHLAEAAPGPDENVAAMMEEVAHDFLRRGEAVAAMMALTRAADLSPDPKDRARRLTEAAYIGAELVGPTSDAETLLAVARQAFPDSGKSLHAANAAVFLLLNADGHLKTAHQILAGAIENGRLDWDVSDTALVESVYNLLLLCCHGGDPRLWEQSLRILARLTPRPPDYLSMYSKTLSDPVRTAAAALDEAETVLSTVATEQDPSRIPRVGGAAIYIDRLADVRDGAWRVVLRGREGGSLGRNVGCYWVLCLDDFLIGRWDECDDLADEALALCDRYGFTFFTWYFRYSKATIAAGRGRFDQARALADEITGWAAPRGMRTAEVFAHQTRTLAALGQRDYEEAFRQATAICPAGTLAPYTPHCLWVLLDVVESAVHTGRHAQARAHVDAMTAVDVAAISPRLAMVQHGAQALVADNDHAGPLFEKALAISGGERWVYDRARIQLAYGEWLRRTKAAARARIQLEAAQEAFQSMGAEPWMARASAELRAAGQPESQDSNSRVARLTAQEREIALLAASGLTNRQIADRLLLSPRTVSAHLYRVFPKLDINSRAALRDALGTTGEQA